MTIKTETKTYITKIEQILDSTEERQFYIKLPNELLNNLGWSHNNILDVQIKLGEVGNVIVVKKIIETCVSCQSNNVEEIEISGYFEFENAKYPLKTKYLKCQDCSTEYLGKHQIKENQEYIASVHLGKEPIKPH